MKGFTTRETENIEQTVRCSIDLSQNVLRLSLDSNSMIIDAEEQSGNVDSLKAQWEYRCLIYGLAAILAIRVLHQENYFELEESRKVDELIAEELNKLKFKTSIEKENEDINIKTIADLEGIRDNVYRYVDIFDDPNRETDPEEVLIDLLRKPLGIVSHLNQTDLVEHLKNLTRKSQLDYMKFFEERAKREA